MWRTTTSAKALLSRESNAADNRRRVCSLRDQGHRTVRRDSNPRSSLWQRAVVDRTELLPGEYLGVESNYSGVPKRVAASQMRVLVCTPAAVSSNTDTWKCAATIADSGLVAADL